MLRKTIKNLATPLQKSNKTHFSTTTTRERWSVKDWFIGEEERRKQGINPATIFEQLKSDKPNKLARRLLYVIPEPTEAKIYEDAALTVLRQGKVTKSYALWDVAKDFNYHTIKGLNELACLSLLRGNIGFQRAICGFEKVIHDYRQSLELLETPILETQKKLGAAYNNLAITYLMKALKNSSKINETLFEKDKTRAMLYFEEALASIPQHGVIMLNIEVAKLMNYRVYVRYPEEKLFVMHEEPTSIFSVIKNNLLDNASQTESHTDLAPIAMFSKNASFGLAATTSYSTKIYADNMHIASEMEKAKYRLEKRLNKEIPENPSLPRLSR
ncbi:MAG TPA: hypothetical protein VHM20_08490 [Gammaproteobacteria bacterium]|jgi:hypothetical protein|nr:hypothetical protein [Gammaproteobacteria bacterium]